jgi:hypothetical protein
MDFAIGNLLVEEWKNLKLPGAVRKNKQSWKHGSSGRMPA